MSQRTGLISQVRGFLLEFGIAVRQGTGVFRMDVPRVLGDEKNELPPSMRSLLPGLWNDFKLKSGSKNFRNRFSAVCSTVTLPDDS
jgi:hypothetical protein